MAAENDDPLGQLLCEALERGLTLVVFQDAQTGDVYLSCTAAGRPAAYSAGAEATARAALVCLQRALGREPTQWCSACECEHPLSHFGRYVPPEGSDPTYWPNGRFHRCLKSERERMRAYCARRRQRRQAAHDTTEGRTA